MRATRYISICKDDNGRYTQPTKKYFHCFGKVSNYNMAVAPDRHAIAVEIWVPNTGALFDISETNFEIKNLIVMILDGIADRDICFDPREPAIVVSGRRDRDDGYIAISGNDGHLVLFNGGGWFLDPPLTSLRRISFEEVVKYYVDYLTGEER